MKLALAVNCWNDEDLMYAKQFGVTHVVGEAVAPQGAQWNTRLLAAMRNRVQKAGLGFAGIESLPQPYRAGVYFRRAMRSGPGRDDEIDAICRFITHAGAAGIPLIGYEWTLASTDEHQRVPEGRGRALVRKYNRHAQTDPAAVEAMWQQLICFLQRVIPAAEKAGVKMACRCSAPPHLPESADAARQPLDGVEALQRLIDTVPSPYNGLDFRQGVIAQMPGVNLIETIGRFAKQQKIFLVEIGNLQVRPPYVVEAFLDERTPQALDATGEGASMLRALQAYEEAGFDDAIRPARPPGLVGDTGWGHMGQAFNIRYLRALIQVVERTR